MPPSIRLYLFEAIKGHYAYMRDAFNSGTDKNQKNPEQTLTEKNILLLFNTLENTIDKVNHIYLNMVQTVYCYLLQYSVTAEELIEADDILSTAFDFGDDFPMTISRITTDSQVQHIITEDGEKYYLLNEGKLDEKNPKIYHFIDYIPEVKSSVFNRIAFYMITGLNLRWSGGEKEDVVVEKYNGSPVFGEISFKQRLFNLINGIYYESN